MKRARGLHELQGQLAAVRGTQNVADWMNIAKILRGRQLFLTLGTERIAGLTGPKGLRQALERRGISLPLARRAFEGVVGRWLKEPFTGELDVQALIRRHASSGQDTETLVTEMTAAERKADPPSPSPSPSPPPPPVPVIAPPVEQRDIVRVKPPPEDPSPRQWRPGRSQEIRGLEEQVRRLQCRASELSTKREVVRIQSRLAELHRIRDSAIGEAFACSWAGNFQWQIAKKTGELEDYRRAQEYCDRSISLFRGLNLERYVIDMSYAGQLASEIAKKTRRLEDWEKAARYCAEAAEYLEQFTGKKEKAIALSLAGQARMFMGDLKTSPEERLAEYRAGTALYAAALPAFRELKLIDNLAHAHNQMGHAQMHSWELTGELTAVSAAIEHLELSGEYFRQAGDFVRAAHSISTAGKCAREIAARTGQMALHRRAAAHSTAAAQMRLTHGRDKKAAAHDLSYAVREHLQIAAVNHDLREMDLAVEKAKQSISLFIETGSAEYVIHVTGAFLEIAGQGYGRAKETGDIIALDVAGEAAKELIALCRMTGNKKREGQAQLILARCCRRKAEAAAAAEEMEKAIEHALLARQLFMEIGEDAKDALGKATLFIAFTCHARGSAGGDLPSLEEAIKYFEDAVRNYVFSPERTAKAQSCLGSALFMVSVKRGDREGVRKAVEHKASAAQIYLDLGQEERAAHNFSHAADAQLETARLTGELSDYEKIIPLKSRAAELFQKLGERKFLAYCFSHIGNAYLKMGLITGRREYLERALENGARAEAIFGELGMEDRVGFERERKQNIEEKIGATKK